MENENNKQKQDVVDTEPQVDNGKQQDNGQGQPNEPKQEPSQEPKQEPSDNGKKPEQEPKNEDVKNFTQEQVNDIVRNRLEKQSNTFYGRYGVGSKEELDELVGKAQSYDVMNEDYQKLNDNFVAMQTENAFLKNNIAPEKYEDIKAYFKGKEKAINDENLKAELESHKEWVRQVNTTTIESISSEEPRHQEKSEKERALDLFRGI